MLIELRIKDFAIIDGLSISFGPGLNVFSGETGAGKSIIIDALALILGDRATNEIIRSSADEAIVEASFDVSGARGIEAVLNEAGIPHAKELIVKRVVQRAGRNKIYVNGSLATLVTLTEVVRRLVDIYGQSEHQSLTRLDEHVEILDGFAGLQEPRALMLEAHKAFMIVKRELESLRANPLATAERASLLAFQIKELIDAALRPGEEEELKKEYERLRNAGTIKTALDNSEQTIYSSTGAITERLGAAISELKAVSAFDGQIVKTIGVLEECLFRMEDEGAFLRDHAQSVEADPEAMEAVAVRLDNIIKLKKKYSCQDIHGLIAFKASIEKESAGLTGAEERIKALETEIAGLRERAAQAAGRLSEARRGAAKELKSRIESELATLGMKGTVFEAHIETEKNQDGLMRFNEKGADRVSFFISPNLGESVKPLSRIASGGELSRIMLAMKSVTAVGRVPTLVFDEIDTGVSGAMAQVVGLKLKEAAYSHQVICITHLPQIAAFADKHFAVSKRATTGASARTITSVKELDHAGHIDEIAAMLGGMKITDVTREHAHELIETADEMCAKKTARKK
ncbi:MAG: DNA repair protein RecN [Deltaproteobacteria bacterium]|nr:DNA repair protein RecN [Deltaproteobacteria bacterium]